MKQSKAMKWQLGACGAFAVFLVFGSVQNSAAFQQAHAKKIGDSTSLAPEQQQEEEDSIVDDWAAQQPSNSSESYNSDTDSGDWSTAPEQESRRSTGRGGMQSQTGRS